MLVYYLLLPPFHTPPCFLLDSTNYLFSFKVVLHCNWLFRHSKSASYHLLILISQWSKLILLFLEVRLERLNQYKAISFHWLLLLRRFQRRKGGLVMIYWGTSCTGNWDTYLTFYRIHKTTSCLHFWKMMIKWWRLIWSWINWCWLR